MLRGEKKSLMFTEFQHCDCLTEDCVSPTGERGRRAAGSAVSGASMLKQLVVLSKTQLRAYGCVRTHFSVFQAEDTGETLDTLYCVNKLNVHDIPT